MSYVTNIIIATRLDDREVNDFNALLTELVESNNNQVVNPFYHVPSDKVGGTKVLEADLFIAAFSYLDLEHFVSFFKKIPEQVIDTDPETLQVMVLDEHDMKWSIYDFDNIDDLLE